MKKYNIKDLIDTYDVEEIKFVNGDEASNPLNKFPIFVINLQDNLYRRNYIKTLFNEYKINYKLIIVKKTTVQHFIKHKIPLVGCALSHMWCLNRAINLMHDKFIIFEDDIIFHKEYIEMIKFNINFDYDLLMLGASDFNLKNNIQYIDNSKHVYFPKNIVCGAFANLYSLNFATKLLEYKLNNFNEFDADFNIFYKKYIIAVAYPNIVVVDLSKTNLSHNYNIFTSNCYSLSCFEKDFSYKNYLFFTIDFIEFIHKNMNDIEINNYENLVDIYIEKFNICTLIKMKYKNIFKNNHYNTDLIKKMLNNINNDSVQVICNL